MQARGLLTLASALVICITALPAAAGPSATDLPRGPGLGTVPFATGAPASATVAPSGRQASSAPTTEDATPVDRYGGFVDGCDDAASGPDIRRLFVVIDPAGDAEFSLMLCDGVDPRSPLPAGGSYSWVVRSGDNGQNYRRIDATKNGTNDFTVAAWTADDEGQALTPIPAAVADPRWRLDTSGPAPRFVVLFAADALGIGPSCEPDGTTPCMAMTFAALDADDAATDRVPDGQAGSPDISSRHSLFWPSPCGVTTGASTGRSPAADSRAVLHVTPASRDAVVAALEAAGYPTTARGVGIVTVEGGVDDAALRAIGALPGVETARRHHDRSPALTPQDPLYAHSSGGQWYLPRIGAPAAWDTTTGSSAVRIGIVDDGIDGSRDDLTGRVAAGYDAISQQPLEEGANSDLGWHGTAVAAVAGATGSTSASATGMAGVDWNAELVPIRVWGHNRCFDEIAYLRGLQWALTEGDLDVLNLSLGGAETIEDYDDLPGERTALRDLVRAGTIVVAAAGNNAWVDAPASYPAALPEVIAVGATGLPPTGAGEDQLAPYSNRGRYVDVVAPGGAGGTASTGILTATDPTVQGAAFGVENGTSFSAPIVAGAAALYLSVRPDATPAEFTRALLATAEDLGAGLAGFDTSFGFGMLNLPGLVTSGSGDTSLTVRTSGNDRYETAVVASRFAYPSPTQVRTVLLATGADFPDALAGAPFAAQRHGPILLTLRDGLPQSTIDELVRLDPTDVVLFGGPSTIAPTVENQLAALDFATVGSCAVALADTSRSSCRLAGATRYETAATIVSLGWAEANVVYVATGGNFPDALAGGATAAAFDTPLLLTAPTELPSATRDQIARLRPELVVVLGGVMSVSDGVLGAIAATPGVGGVVRASGSGRYETAVAALCPDVRVCISDTRYVTIATGDGFADALSGSAVAAALRAPLLLADPRNPDAPALADALTVLEAERAVILGGLATLPAPVETSISRYVVR